MNVDPMSANWLDGYETAMAEVQLVLLHAPDDLLDRLFAASSEAFEAAGGQPVTSTNRAAIRAVLSGAAEEIRRG